MSTTTDQARLVIAGNVRAAMTRTRTKQKDLAAILATSEASISRRLNGSQPFDVDELLLVAAALETPVTELFHGVAPPLIHALVNEAQMSLFACAA